MSKVVVFGQQRVLVIHFPSYLQLERQYVTLLILCFDYFVGKFLPPNHATFPSNLLARNIWYVSKVVVFG